MLTYIGPQWAARIATAAILEADLGFLKPLENNFFSDHVVIDLLLPGPLEDSRR